MLRDAKQRKTLLEFNDEVNNFIKENSKRIACIITSSVSYTYQPLLVGYQNYFNQNVKNIYDSKAIYAHNPEQPDFIYSYFVLTRENKKFDSPTVKEHCDIYVNNFLDFNKKVFTAISAQIYDVGKFEVLEEINYGNMDSLESVDFLNKL